MTKTLPYNSYSSSMQEKYGYKIWRVGVDAGFSCPNRDCNKEGGCIYCDALGAKAAYLRTNESGFNRKSSFEKEMALNLQKQDIASQVERGVEFLKRRYKAQHFALYFQSFSNTFAPVAKLKEIYDYALSLMDWDELIISTRPDCIDKEKVALLASYLQNLDVTVELGLQSGSDKILKAMNRGHSVQKLLDSAKLIQDADINLGLHILTGFPGEGPDELEQTVKAINAVHPNNIKIHNLNIASGTGLYHNYLEGEVTSPCARRHIANTVYILRRIPQDVVIERLICETPSHRLASPRLFPDKNQYLLRLEKYMNDNGYKQGDLYK